MISKFLAQTNYDYDYDYSTTTELDPAATAGVLAVAGVIWLFALAVAAVAIVAMWKMFKKAGRPGWAAIVPIYNNIILLEIVGRPAWWVILMFIPFVNIAILAIISLDLAKAFGKSSAFGIVALFFFSVVGYLIIGFGKDTYVGPPHNEATTNTLQQQPPAAPRA